MNKPILVILLAYLIPCQPAWSQALSQKAAVALAERFIVENGYTTSLSNQIKQHLDRESIEWTDRRSEMLKQRHNTLQPIAIGAKPGRKGSKSGWSIAFAYSAGVRGGQDSCRIVTMDADGSNIRIEHVDGIREYFSGFN